MTEAPRKRQKLAPTPEQQTIKQFTSDFRFDCIDPLTQNFLMIKKKLAKYTKNSETTIRVLTKLAQCIDVLI